MKRCNLLGVALLLLEACGGRTLEGCGGVDKGAVDELSVQAPPRGEWHIEPSLISNVAFPMAHIVISHKTSEPLTDLPWLPDLRSERTREQARMLAIDVWKRASATPSSFGALARDHSDDKLTGAFGGSVGPVAGIELTPMYLDAFYALRDTNSFVVFESPSGYHVVRREELGPAKIKNLQAIMLRYDEADEGSRAATYEKIEMISRSLKEDPDAFPALADEHSELDGHPGGNCGPFTQLSVFPPALVKVALGFVDAGISTAAIETPQAFWIARWTEARHTERLAATLVLVREQAGGAAATEAMRQVAASLREKLKDDCDQECLRVVLADACPSCPLVTRQWWEGQHDDAVERVVKVTEIGKFATDVATTGHGFVIAKREAPGGQLELIPELTTVLPHIEYKDIDYFIDKLSDEQLANYTRQLADASAKLDLAEEHRRAVRKALLELSARFVGQEQEQRRRLLQAHDEELRTKLGVGDFQVYARFRASWIRTRQLGI